MSRLSVAELRPVAQPPGLLDRESGEHWAGRLYMRRLSPYVTVIFARTPVRPDTITGLMVVVGLVAAAVLVIPGLAAAIVAAIGIQLYLLLDCSDGELARWRGTTSVRGVYLDRVGHYLVEAGLLVALGARAADGADGWLVLGFAAALGAILVKAETDLVDVARARYGAAPASDTDAKVRARGLGRLRRGTQMLRAHRLIQAVELSIAAVGAAAYDAVAGGLTGTRVLLVACAVVAALLVPAHLVSILASSRLR
jgi:phosphatidylglycerophosphate synthase